MGRLLVMMLDCSEKGFLFLMKLLVVMCGLSSLLCLMWLCSLVNLVLLLFRLCIVVMFVVRLSSRLLMFKWVCMFIRFGSSVWLWLMMCWVGVVFLRLLGLVMVVMWFLYRYMLDGLCSIVVCELN